jgi:hypothetical protein
MGDIPTAAQITSLISLLAPGLIISSIRARAITGSVPDYKDRLIAYAIISIGYFAAVAPLFHVESSLRLPDWLWSFLQYFLVPTFLGIAAAYIHQWQWVYKTAECFGLQLAHHLPAAWDYTFQALPVGTFIIVTLTDGTQIPGKMGRNSFAASSKEERDLLIEELWEVATDGTWQASNPTRNILLCGKDIKYIEIF